MSDRADEPLLDGATLRQLERLRLRDLDAIVRGLLGETSAGAGSGGRGLEFADYRAYVPGDDLRRIDWNVYARLNQPFIRTSPLDRELGLALLLDGSRSMGDRGAPARRHAEQVAALVGAVALLRGGTVQLTILADGDGVNGEPLTGEQHVPLLLEQLDRLPRGRSTDLAAGIHKRRPLEVGAEIAALLTDALIPLEALDDGLNALRGTRAATLLHVAEPGATAALEGPVELVDRESGELLALDVTPAVLAAHAEALAEHARKVESHCRRFGIGYVSLPAGGNAFDQVTALADEQELLDRAR
ncbi:MAG TPA: DUF58 domain-containing protein [Conexibacter sp.]|jgi:uncharacterized protein (DUF58 family)